MMGLVIRRLKSVGTDRGRRTDSDSRRSESLTNPVEVSTTSSTTAVGGSARQEAGDDNVHGALVERSNTTGLTATSADDAAAVNSDERRRQEGGITHVLLRQSPSSLAGDGGAGRSLSAGSAIAASRRRSSTSVGSDLTRDLSSSQLYADAAPVSPSSSSFARRSSSLSYLSGSTSQSRKRLQELTVNKLQFAKLGRLYGRERECQCLEGVWEDVLASFRYPGSRGRRGQESSELSGVASASGGAAEASGRAPAGRRRFVAISGEGGSGKSALAGDLRSKVVQSGGLFVQGKFPQPSAALVDGISPSDAEPFSAFSEATAHLCKSVVEHYAGQSGHSASRTTRTGSFSSLSRFRDKLGSEIGPDAPLIMRVIPESAQLLSRGRHASGPNRHVSFSEPAFEWDASMKEAQHQFKHAFRRFIRAVTRIAPLVLVLDDMQWADIASLDLLEALLSDQETSSLMVVACYRSTGEDATSGDNSEKHGSQIPPPAVCIQTIRTLSAQANSLTFDSIVVGNLDAIQINDLLTDLLSLPASETLNLAHYVHKKTAGNIFFVIQYLQVLEEASLLQYNICALKWIFDLQAIRDSTFSTENVVYLVKRKLERLPAPTKKVLPIMACLGSKFTLRSFQLAVDRMPTTDKPEQRSVSDASMSLGDAPGSLAVRYLSQCEEEGLIEMLNDDGEVLYRWVHDKIQEAAFSLLSEDSLRNLKRMMGKLLWEGFDSVELDNNIFLVSRLLSTSMSGSDGERSKDLSSLFLRAGVKAVERSAFDIASGYLRSGIGQLSEDPWEVDSKLSLDLFSAAAEVEFCLGNLESAHRYCDEVVRRESVPFLDKRRAYNVLIACAAAEQRKDDAFTLCKNLLSKLGCQFPKRAIPLHVAAVIFRVKSSVKRYTSHESISQLPILEDEKLRWMMTLLDKLATYAYLTDPMLLPLIAFKGLRITLKAGLCEYAPPMFASIGFLLTVFVHDFQAGQAFADRSIELLSRVTGARKVEARVLFLTHTFVFHWTRPASLSLKPLQSSFESGVVTGDTESASYGICFYIDHAFRTGAPLQELIEDCAFYAESIKEAQQMNILLVMEYLWQTFMFLTGDNQFAGPFKGDVVDQDKLLQDVAKENYDVLFFGIYRLQMYVAFVLGQYEQVYRSIMLTRTHLWSYEKIFPGIFGLCHLYTFNALSMLSLYRETEETSYLRLAKKFGSRIKKWARKRNPNSFQFDALLDAEFASLQGFKDHAVAASRFEVAILYSGRCGLTQDRALSHERYGEHLTRLGPPFEDDASYQIGQAIRLYEEWGAHAKVSLMKSLHAPLLEPSSSGFHQMQMQQPFASRSSRRPSRILA